MRVGVLDRHGEVWDAVAAATQGLGGGIGAKPVDGAAALAAEGALDVLVIGPKEMTAAGLRRVEAWHAAHPASVVVAAVPATGGPTLRQLRPFGVRALVRGNPTTAKVQTALRKATDELRLIARESSGLAEGLPEVEIPAARAASDVETDLGEADLTTVTDAVGRTAGGDGASDDAEDAPIRHGRVITVASPTGGCGKTFLSTNAATLLARAGHRVLLVDLDLQFGEVAPALGLRHPFSIHDGLYDDKGQRLPESALGEHLEQLVCPTTLGFDVLTAPRNPELADDIGARDAAHVIASVRDRYDVIVLDTPPSLNEVVLTALDLSDLVIVLSTLDVPCLKNLTVFLDTLARLRIDSSRVRMLLNKVEKDVGIDVKQAQEAFDGRFLGALVHSRAVSRSLNRAQPVVVLEPKDPVSAQLIRALAGTLPPDLKVGLAPTRDGRDPWWRRVLRRRGGAS